MDTWPKLHDHQPVPVTIDYNLERHGWASLEISLDGTRNEIGSFGYCTDALGDLVRAALAMAVDTPRAKVVLDGEPHLWALTIQDGWQSTRIPRAFRFSIRSNSGDSFDDQSSPYSWPKVLTECFVTADAFATAVSVAAHQVLNEHGEEGYLARWVRFRFPTRALVALDAALATPSPIPAEGSPLSR